MSIVEAPPRHALFTHVGMFHILRIILSYLVNEELCFYYLLIVLLVWHQVYEYAFFLEIDDLNMEQRAIQFESNEKIRCILPH